MSKQVLDGYEDHLSALADEAIEPEDIDVWTKHATGTGSFDLTVNASAARHTEGALPQPSHEFFSDK